MFSFSLFFFLNLFCDQFGAKDILYGIFLYIYFDRRCEMCEMHIIINEGMAFGMVTRLEFHDTHDEKKWYGAQTPWYYNNFINVANMFYYYFSSAGCTSISFHFFDSQMITGLWYILCVFLCFHFCAFCES